MTPGFLKYPDLFRMPLYEQTKNDYYSLNVGEIHLISLNVKDPLANSKTILDWLVNDLSNFQKFSKWTIVLTNRPIYLISDDLAPYELEFYQNLQQILKDYNVDLVFASGGGFYQRTIPLNKQESFGFRGFESNNRTIKKCIKIDDCESYLIIEPEAPIYISENYDRDWKDNNSSCLKNG